MKSPSYTAAAALLLCSGLALAQANLPDRDEDGIPDVMDNCLVAANTEQADSDADGIGDACDADINNDGAVNTQDLALLRANFGKPRAAGDLNGDGSVNSLDLAQLRRLFGKPPGPTGLGATPPTRDGRQVPVASQVELLRLAQPLPDGRNALVSMDFGAYWRAGDNRLPEVQVVHNSGDPHELLRQGFTPADLGRPNGLGRAAGELLVLNDLGLFGDEKPGDGVFSGLARLDAAQMEGDAKAFVERLRAKKGRPVRLFNGREVAVVGDFNPDDAFDPPGPERVLSFNLPKFGLVTTLAIPFPKLKLFLPPSTDAERTLMVTDLGVVQDPGRSFSPCNNAGAFVPTGNVNGPWSFKTLMTNMANTAVTGITPQVFVNEWLRQWLVADPAVPHDDGVNVPFPIPARPALQTVIQSVQPGWNPANPATLDMNRLPLRLLAIVNRIDLAQGGYLGSGSPGELRFVFGLLERNAAGACVPSREMTVILEYKVPTSNCTGLKLLANQWIALDALVPGTPAYNAQLQALTDQVSLPNAFPGKLNASAIGQVRTNEVRLGLPWELREFTLQPSPVHGLLRHETVKNTPNHAHNGGPQLTDWIEHHAGQTLPRQHLGVDFIGSANRYGPGAFPANPPWNGTPSSDPGKRFLVSSNTCGGCHLNETGTGFTMVKADGPLGAPAVLAGFLTGINNVPDPVYGPPHPLGLTHDFHDLWNRGQKLDQIAAKQCLVLPELPLLQAPQFLRLPRPPEALFSPRFVH